jgi:ABC transporter substrate binding protein
MIKKILVCLLATFLLTTAPHADAQQPKKVPLIGYLSSSDSASESSRAEAIRLALLERGYVEGKNIAIEYRYTEGKRDRFPELAAELVRLKVDILVVGGADPGTRAAKDATKTIPIVMMGGGLDPVKAGLVESLARPGGNVTGITNLITELRELMQLAVARRNGNVTVFSYSGGFNGSSCYTHDFDSPLTPLIPLHIDVGNWSNRLLLEVLAIYAGLTLSDGLSLSHYATRARGSKISTESNGTEMLPSSVRSIRPSSSSRAASL